MFAASENQLQPQLNVARRIRLSGDNAKVRTVDSRSRSTEDGSIRQVECFGPERKFEALRDLEILKQREIQILRLVQANASVGSRHVAGGEIRRLRKRGSIEPLVNALAARQHRIANDIGMLSPAKG